MQKELEKLVNLNSGKITFKDSQIDYMLQNIGNLNPHLRDNVIYTLFSRGFLKIPLLHSRKQRLLPVLLIQKICLRESNSQKMI